MLISLIFTLSDYLGEAEAFTNFDTSVHKVFNTSHRKIFSPVKYSECSVLMTAITKGSFFTFIITQAKLVV